MEDYTFQGFTISTSKAGNYWFHPELTPCTCNLRTFGVFHHLRACNCNQSSWKALHSVCKQWRDIARDDYFWKCLCAKRWPSIFKRSTPPSVSYRELLQKFCRRYRGNLNIGPRFSFDDLEFYLDIWDIPVDEERLLFSEVIPGSVLGGGIRDLPPGFIEVHKLYLDSPGYKMLIPVEPKFCLLFEEVRVSLVVGRKDTNQLACIFEKFEYIIDQNSEDEIMVRFTRPVLGDGMKVLPPYDSEIDMSYFGRHGYKVIMPVQPRFSIDFTPPVPDFSDLIAWVSSVNMKFCRYYTYLIGIERRTFGVFHHLRACNCNQSSQKALHSKFCRLYHGNLNLGPRFSFDVLEFYLNIWANPVDEEILFFSEVIPRSVLEGGISDLPPGFIEIHKLYLDGPGYKMLIPVELKFCLLFEEVRVSVVVGRKDTNQLTCIFEKLECIIDQFSEDNEIKERFIYPVFRDGMKVLPPNESETDFSYLGSRHGYKVNSLFFHSSALTSHPLSQTFQTLLPGFRCSPWKIDTLSVSNVLLWEFHWTLVNLRSVNMKFCHYCTHLIGIERYRWLSGLCFPCCCVASAN
ncbi:hypothetical protein NE237_021926 [Protea cynaroides]|uniref:F-box domain-containing protein n=1 Tax=Protea cynaroides TaxID=273540 RepID=A0A9Q0H8P1_9MAGN|nr:hypothetical protein NE237_021926 [Protea cynaroides]